MSALPPKADIRWACRDAIYEIYQTKTFFRQVWMLLSIASVEIG